METIYFGAISSHLIIYVAAKAARRMHKLTRGAIQERVLWKSAGRLEQLTRGCAELKHFDCASPSR